ncbi:MAG: ATP-dependent zinc metalloprotease FtsH [Treponemataceae bacterium]|nr:ATP-dependent zinc metalloprotease FtsH [Treponemataceae bacterium]
MTKYNGKEGRAGLLFFVVMLILLVAYFITTRTGSSVPEISYTDFLEYVKTSKITEVHIKDGSSISGVIQAANGQSSHFKTEIPYEDESLMETLRNAGIEVSGSKSKESIVSLILSYMPWVLTLVFFMFIMRQNASQNMKGMQFGKSRARVFDSSGKKVMFVDVAGQEEAKKELAEIVDFLRTPKKYQEMGAKIPTGVLLVGNPGTGKTLLARAVAGEAGVNFLHISGSDFVEMFVGVGASRVRDLFEQGRRMAPSIIFIDEIDAVGRARGAGLGGGHDEREQTLNQMLVEMDGFDNKDGVIVLAATNRPDVLDPALLRPGRFDRQITVSLPDLKERCAILAVHAKRIPLGNDVNLEKVARATPGMSGADLANIVNEAALFAARKGQKSVGSSEFEEARDKILMGVARDSMVMPEKERAMTACHEAGHTLPYYYLKNASPLHKVTIIPRGRALGLTVGLPKEDSYSHTKGWLLDQLVIMFGGYAAETVVYGETTTGTQNDIQQATNLARRMVCEWGMSEEVGAVTYGQEDEPIFMGREIARHKEFSEYTAHQIDTAVRKILDNAKERACAIMMEHRDQLDLITKALIENETLDDADIRRILGFPTENFDTGNDAVESSVVAENFPEENKDGEKAAITKTGETETGEDAVK